MHAPRRPTLLLLAVLSALAACADRPNPAEPVLAPADGVSAVTAVNCTATVPDARVQCGDLSVPGGPRMNIVLGGQGTYVRLRSDSVRSDPAAGTFSMRVTVQNLLDQVMGTPDGTMVAGMRVFFSSPPAATRGTGDVAVTNADGEGTFTEAGQPYFRYDEILQPLGESGPRTWAFSFTPGVEAFAFTVYVETTLPQEQGALRWVQERGTFTADYPSGFSTALWGASENSLFLTMGPSILHFDGTRWRTMSHPATSPLNDVYGTSTRNVYAVAALKEVLRYDGTRWARLLGPEYYHPLAAIAADGGRVVAVGTRALPSTTPEALMMVSGDSGRTWKKVTRAGAAARELLAVWVHGDEVLAAGAEYGSPWRALLLRSVNGGSTWAEVPLPSSKDHRVLSAIWRDASGEIWLGGRSAGQALILHSADTGVTWSDTIVSGGNAARDVLSFWRSPGGDLHAAGYGGTFLRLRDGVWSDLTGPEGETIHGLWGVRQDHVLAAASGGAMYAYDGEGWSRQPPPHPPADPSETLLAISGYGPDGIYTVGYDGDYPAYQGVILHAGAGGWERWALPGVPFFTSVWAGGPADVWVVADMNRWLVPGEREGLWRKASSGWTKVTLPLVEADSFFRLDVVTGSGPRDVYVFGRLHRYSEQDRLLVFHSTDRGHTWTRISPPDSWGRRVVAASAPGPGELYATGVLGANTNFVLRYEGTSWFEPAFYTGGMNAIWSQGGEVFLAGGGGDQFSRTGGVVWHSPDRGVTWDLSLRQSIPNLYALWGTSVRDLYAVGRYGTIARWDGERWTVLPVGGGPEWRGIWGTSSREMWVVGRGGSIMHGTR